MLDTKLASTIILLLTTLGRFTSCQLNDYLYLSEFDDGYVHEAIRYIGGTTNPYLFANLQSNAFGGGTGVGLSLISITDAGVIT